MSKHKPIIIYWTLLTSMTANNLSCWSRSVFQHLIKVLLFTWQGKYLQTLIRNTCPKNTIDSKLYVIAHSVYAIWKTIYTKLQNKTCTVILYFKLDYKQLSMMCEDSSNIGLKGVKRLKYGGSVLALHVPATGSIHQHTIWDPTTH